MHILEMLYEKPPTLTNFNTRKVQITHSNILLCGANGSGKTTLILDFLQEVKNYLYIDLNDLRLNLQKIQSNLESFLKDKNIELLVIENYKSDFKLPSHVELIVSSNDNSLYIEGLEKIHLDMLDFEEFISFRKGSLSPETLFGLFVQHGRMALHVNENEIIQNLQNHLKIILKNDLEIFLYFASLQARVISPNQIYMELKNRLKISKDRLYKLTNEFENRDLIHFLPKFDSPKSTKKLYLGDFVLKDAITYEKDFMKKFQNMVFCELCYKQNELYYTDFLDFYAPKNSIAIICSPFAPPEIIIKKFEKNIQNLKNLEITKLRAITLGNEQKIFHEGMACEIIPFWDWALQN